MCNVMCVEVRGQLSELLLFFCHVASGEQTQAASLGGKHYPLGIAKVYSNCYK